MQVPLIAEVVDERGKESLLPVRKSKFHKAAAWINPKSPKLQLLDQPLFAVCNVATKMTIGALQKDSDVIAKTKRNRRVGISEKGDGRGRCRY